MRRIIGLSLAIALAITAITAIPTAAQSDNSRLNIGDEEQFVTSVFYGPTDVLTYLVTIPAGGDGDGRNGRLVVDTLDGGAPGLNDNWGVRIIKHNGKVMDEAVGNGSMTEFSGAASIMSLPRKTVLVEVFYDSGVDVWPANLLLRITFGGENIEAIEVVDL